MADLKPLLSDLEPLMSDLEPTMSDLEPTMADLKPLLYDLEPLITFCKPLTTFNGGYSINCVKKEKIINEKKDLRPLSFVLCPSRLCKNYSFFLIKKCLKVPSVLIFFVSLQSDNQVYGLYKRTKSRPTNDAN